MSSSQTKVSELVRLLRQRVEDSSGLAFTPQELYDSLDSAQRYICSVIHNSYLTSLEREITVLATSGFIDLSTLADSNNNTLFRGNILSISYMVENSVKDFKRVELSDIYKLDNTYLSANPESYYYYVFADKINLRPQNSYTVVIQYLTQPNEIYNAENSAIAEHCELEKVLIDPLLDFAEAYLWKMDNKPNRVQLCQTNGVTLINLLNERFSQERILGLKDVGDK